MFFLFVLSLRKQPAFRDATNGFPAKRVQKFHTNDASLNSIRSTTQIRVVTRRQYGISALIPQTLLRREIAKCCLFSQAVFFFYILSQKP